MKTYYFKKLFIFLCQKYLNVNINTFSINNINTCYEKDIDCPQDKLYIENKIQLQRLFQNSY